MCISIIIYSCNRNEENNDPCANSVFDYEIITTPADSCVPQAALKITSQTNKNMEFGLDNSEFQQSNTFENIIPGTHLLALKNEYGCVKKVSVTIKGKTTMGPLFLATKTILLKNCTPCHVGFSPFGDFDFNDNCIITSSWLRIETRALKGEPSTMPQGGLIPIAERDIIAKWIKAGHRYSD